MRGRADALRKPIVNIGTDLQHVRAAAEQFEQTWALDLLAAPRQRPHRACHRATATAAGAAGDGVTAGCWLSYRSSPMHGG
jgi:hypothetical protein